MRFQRCPCFTPVCDRVGGVGANWQLKSELVEALDQASKLEESTVQAWAKRFDEQATAYASLERQHDRATDELRRALEQCDQAASEARHVGEADSQRAAAVQELRLTAQQQEQCTGELADATVELQRARQQQGLQAAELVGAQRRLQEVEAELVGCRAELVGAREDRERLDSLGSKLDAAMEQLRLSRQQ